ncbi:MAG: hypothetical protein ACOYOB_15710 [Myxococcota bacterium]
MTAYTLPRAAARVLDALTAHLDLGEVRVLPADPGVRDAIRVERVGLALFHVGEATADCPEGAWRFAFLRDIDGLWLPVSHKAFVHDEDVAVIVGPDGLPEMWEPIKLKHLRIFSSMWLVAVARQRDGVRRLRYRPLSTNT